MNLRNKSGESALQMAMLGEHELAMKQAFTSFVMASKLVPEEKPKPKPATEAQQLVKPLPVNSAASSVGLEQNDSNSTTPIQEVKKPAEPQATHSKDVKLPQDKDCDTCRTDSDPATVVDLPKGNPKPAALVATTLTCMPADSIPVTVPTEKLQLISNDLSAETALPGRVTPCIAADTTAAPCSTDANTAPAFDSSHASVPLPAAARETPIQTASDGSGCVAASPGGTQLSKGPWQQPLDRQMKPGGPPVAEILAHGAPLPAAGQHNSDTQAHAPSLSVPLSAAPQANNASQCTSSVSVAVSSSAPLAPCSVEGQNAQEGTECSTRAQVEMNNVSEAAAQAGQSVNSIQEARVAQLDWQTQVGYTLDLCAFLFISSSVGDIV